MTDNTMILPIETTMVLEVVREWVKNHYTAKEGNKGLSTNDFTDELKAKLESIEANANVNIIEGVNVNNIALVPDRNKYINIVIPTKISDLLIDGNVVVDANYVHTDNNYTTEEKNKLNNISDGAEANVQSDWNENDSSSDAYIKNKPFSRLGKGLKVVDGELQVSVVEHPLDISQLSLDEQIPYRDSAEMETFLEKFKINSYSKQLGNLNSYYIIQHNLNSDSIVLQVWSMTGEELPSYTAKKIDNNSLSITFSESIPKNTVIISVSSAEYSDVDMIPWSNISNVTYATKHDMIKILNNKE